MQYTEPESTTQLCLKMVVGYLLRVVFDQSEQFLRSRHHSVFLLRDESDVCYSLTHFGQLVTRPHRVVSTLFIRETVCYTT